ncbi:MAG: MucB/RseB C-terminal domain-containing protein [Sulfurifustaceae bacterium]
MSRLPSFFPASVFIFFVSLPAQAANEAQDWLLRVHQSAQRLSYEGTFVYQHGTRLETMRVIHRAKKGVVTERLISLTGPAREVIRTDDEVRCYLPDQKSVVVEHRPLDHPGFVAIIPERLNDLAENYAIELGHTARIAGRAAQQLVLRGRDDYRYGYRIWADRETGLLLRADVVDEAGKRLEQFMFTQISIGGHIPDAALAPQSGSGDDMVWYRDSEIPPGAPTRSWRAANIPKGFKLARTVVRRLPKSDRVVEQLVYSDSLAAVSIFIERMDDHVPPSMMEGPANMGALHALGKTLDGHHVTVVGDVPAKTIAMFGSSLVPAPTLAR